jgi:hypothetical protein
MVESTPITHRTGELKINANAAGGRLVVEVLDPLGQVLPGYAATECQEIAGDNVRHRVRWTRHERLPAQGPFCLRFHLRHSSLYSYTIE